MSDLTKDDVIVIRPFMNPSDWGLWALCYMQMKHPKKNWDRIIKNYEDALRDVEKYHRWFIELRDGKGGWADQTAELRERIQRLETERDHFIEVAHEANVKLRKLRERQAGHA